MKKRQYLAYFSAFLFLPLALFAADAPRVSLVTTQAVEKGQVASLQTFIGSVILEQRASVASSQSGLVVHVGFREGEKIEKNQVLAKLDTDILDANIVASRAFLAQNRVNLEKAKKDLARVEKLFSQKAISQASFDDTVFATKSAEQQYASAKATLRSMELEKEKKTIKAPFGGIIVSKQIEIGDWIGTGGVLASLVNPSSAEVRIDLPEEIALNLQKNMPVSILINAKKYAGFVGAVIPKGDVATRTFPVKILFKETQNELLDGMSAQVEIQNGPKVEALLVPRDALIKRFGQNVVFIDANATAVMIPATVVGYTDSKIAVSASGLKAGDRVVTKGNERIFPKSPLRDISGAQ